MGELAPVEVHYQRDGAPSVGRLVRARLEALVVAGEPPEPGTPLRFKLRGGVVGRADLGGVGRAVRVGAPGAPVFAIKLARLTSGSGIPPLKELLRQWACVAWRDLKPDRIVRIGNFVALTCDPSDPNAPLRRLPRIPRTWLRQYFEEHLGEGLFNLYVRRNVTYVLNTIPYGGRAVRIGDATMTVDTNMTLPNLGNVVFVQLPVTVPEGDTYIVFRGGVVRRSDQRDVAVWKGRFELKIFDIEEIEYAGALRHLLDELRAQAQASGA